MNFIMPPQPDFHKEIWVHEFTQESAECFRNQVLFKAEHDPVGVIPIYINSYGGYADCLAQMIETMGEVENKFITAVSGCAMSCGAILLSEGDVRYCGKYSRVMVHHVSSMSYGDAYENLAESHEGIRMNTELNGLLAKNCGVTYDELRDKIRHGIAGNKIYLDAAQAIEFGIVDFIGTPRITPHAFWECQVAPEKERGLPEIPEEPKKKTRKKKSKKGGTK